MNCNYKVKIKDIQSKYTFKIFCAGADTTEIEQEVAELDTRVDTLENDITDKEDKSNKVTTLSNASTDTQYPSAKCVYDSQTLQDETIEQNTTNIETNTNSIEELKAYYEGIYNVLPKVSGNGESITLDNTGESILKLDTRGQCKQETTTGKNLIKFPYDSSTGTYANVSITLNNDGSLLVNGTGNDTGYFNFSAGDNRQLLKAGTYTLSLQQSGIECSVSSVGSLAYISRTQTSATFTINEDTYVSIYIAVRNGVSYNNLLVQPMLEEGSSATNWEKPTNGSSPNPSYPQQIHEVSGDNKIKVYGKNLLDSNYYSDKTLYTTSSSYYAYVKMPDTFKTTFYGKVVLKGTTQNNLVLGFSSSNNNIDIGYRILNSGSSYTRSFDFTNAENVYLIIGNGSGININNDIPAIFNNYDIMISKEDIDYEPYNGDTYELDLGVENLLNCTITEKTTNGLTFTPVYDSKGLLEYINVNGTASADTRVPVTETNVFTLEQGKEYTLTGCPSGGNSSTYSLYINLTGQIETGSGLSFTRTGSSSPTNISIDIKNGTICNNLKFKPMVENSLNVNSYSPYGQTPIKMRGIGTYEDYFVRNSGKNLLDTSNVTGAGWNIYGIPNTLKPNTKYTFSIQGTTSFSYGLFTTSGTDSSTTITRLANYQSAGNSVTFTTPADMSNEQGLLLGGNSSGAGSESIDVIKPQIELGETKTPYEPYGTGKWCKYNAIVNVVLDGSENWDVWNLSSETLQRFYTNLLNENEAVRGSTEYFLCNRFKYVSSYTTEGFNWSDASGIYKQVVVVINRNRLSSVDETGMENWVSDNNLMFNFPLKTPYLSLVENETLISQLDKLEKALSKDGQTNISQINNDVPFKIYASALKDMSDNA